MVPGFANSFPSESGWVIMKSELSANVVKLVRTLFYGLGCAVMLAAGFAMALLPRLAPAWWLFALAGAALSGLISGAWLLIGATAGRRQRPRTGQVLIAGGLCGLGLSFWDAHWIAVIWSSLVLIAGLAFTFPSVFGPSDRASAGGTPGPVRPPLRRRQQT